MRSLLEQGLCLVEEASDRSPGTGQGLRRLSAGRMLEGGIQMGRIWGVASAWDLPRSQGAPVALVCLLQTGVSDLTIAATILILFATILSRLLF